MLIGNTEKKLTDTELSLYEDDPNWPLPLPESAHASANTHKQVFKRRRFISFIVVIVVTIVVLVLALGLYFGLKSGHPATSAMQMSNSDPDGGHGQTTGSSVVQNCSVHINDSFSSKTKWQGVNLGNWLILERWMNPTFYSYYTGINKTDEWSFCESLGPTCGETLENHWKTWVTSQEIAQLAAAGFNLLRVPIGFWAFVTPQPWEPYYYGSQTNQLTRILSYAKTYNISVIVDLHGLPGSQNGYEHSGHAGLINFFNETNQARSASMLDAVVAYVRDSRYQEQIAAIEVANEPNLDSSKNLATYRKYLKSAYQKIASLNTAINRNITMMFHDGFLGAAQFEGTFNSCDMVVVDYHLYFSNSGASQSSVRKALCAVSTSSDSQLRLFFGEWSLSSNYPGDGNWTKNFFNTQASIYSNTTGSAFWSFKDYNADGFSQNTAWSVQGLLAEQAITPNVTWGTANSFCN